MTYPTKPLIVRLFLFLAVPIALYGCRSPQSQNSAQWQKESVDLYLEGRKTSTVVIERLKSPTDAVLRSESLPTLVAEADGIRAQSRLIGFDTSAIAIQRKDALSKIADSIQGLADRWIAVQQGLSERERLTKQLSADAAVEKRVKAEDAERQREREAARDSLDAVLRQARERLIAMEEEVDYKRAANDVSQQEFEVTQKKDQMRDLSLRDPEQNRLYIQLSGAIYQAEVALANMRGALANMPIDASLRRERRRSDSLETVRRFLRKLSNNDLRELGVDRTSLSSKLDSDSTVDGRVASASRTTEKTKLLLSKAKQAVELGKKGLSKCADHLSRLLDQAQSAFKTG